MPTTWEQMFDTGRDASVATEAEEEERRGLFSRMRESLSKSRKAMTQQLTAVMFDPADADVWERLEEALIYADCGVAATVEVIERLEGEADAGGLRSAEELGDRLAAIVAELMRPGRRPSHRCARPAGGDPDDGRERHRQDHVDRQDRLPPAGGRDVVRDRRCGYVPRGGGRAAGGLG